jgi:hypothetical protein
MVVISNRVTLMSMNFLFLFSPFSPLCFSLVICFVALQKIQMFDHRVN